MYIRKGLLLQLHWLSCLGILPVYKNQNELQFLPNNSKRWYAHRISFYLYTLIILVDVISITLTAMGFKSYTPYTFAGWIDKDRLYMYGCIICGTTQLLSNIFLYLSKELNLKMLKSVVRLDNKYKHFGINTKVNIWIDFTFRLFLIYLVLLVICSTNILFLIFNFQTSILNFALLGISNFLFGGLQSIFYASLVKVVNETLVSINKKIESVSNPNTNIDRVVQVRELLLDRNELLRLCENEISFLYGIMLLLHFGSLIVNVPVRLIHIFLLLQNNFFKSDFVLYIFFNDLLIWTSPIMLKVAPLFHGDITEEANKTARILSRISRRGTDIEKLVDKFLMKNIQQKPILTAYGFFPLNKRTLFKIFAAIFTYMVILIQFKDMENINKKLGSPKTTTLSTTVTS